MDVTISHYIPGRLRVVVKGIRNHELGAYRLQETLRNVPGIHQASCNASTGRALIHFDETLVSVEQVLEVTSGCTWQTCHPNTPSSPTVDIAATIESELSTVPVANRHDFPAMPTGNPYLLPTVASSSLLGILSLKRLFMGRSVLATSPFTFWAAAGVSIVAGYPALRRGIEDLIRQRKATPDLWMGLATLSMAAVRENIVALSVITAVNMAMYRRYQGLNMPEDTRVDPGLERHSQQMSRLSLWLAPLSLILTRSPLRALGVALAANPRPAILSHKYRWAQAEHEAKERHLAVQCPGGLSALAAAKNIVFTDERILLGDEQEWKVVAFHNKCEPSSMIATAASLMSKSEKHPWHHAMTQRASELKKALHTPFNVEVEDDGVRGTIQGHQVLLGNRVFLTKHGIDDTPILMDERRLMRQGFETQILVSNGQILGLIACKRGISSKCEQIIDSWQAQGYAVRVLRTDQVRVTGLEQVNADALLRDLEAGTRTICIGSMAPLEHPNLIPISPEDFERLPEALSFCQEKQAFTKHEMTVIKAWNWLGIGLAMFAPVTAPLLALSGDVVAMYLFAAQSWKLQNWRNALKGVFTKQAKQRESPQQRAHLEGNRDNYHSGNIRDWLKKLGVDLAGLTTHQVMERQGFWGPNVLPRPESPSPIRLFLNQFKELSTLILLGTAGLSLIMGEPVSTLCMVGILIVNALIGTWQEKRSTDIVKALKVEDDACAKVIRDGAESTVDVKELVPGDIVLLEPGDKVPADLRIIEASGLEVNEAMLTGESVPVMKHEGDLVADTPLADRSNLLYMGTVVTRGRCTGLVVATGTSTEIGTVESLLLGQEDEPTFLQTRVADISKRFVKGAFVAAGVVCVAGLLRGVPPLQLLLSSVTLAASAIPEGLPLTITVALTAGVLKMSKKRTVVKKLANLESLGRVTVICCDKTGTLTKNEMTVKEMSTLSGRVLIDGDGYEQSGNFYSSSGSSVQVSDDVDMRQLLTIGLLCNNARLTNDPSRGPHGDPTELAILTVTRKANLNGEAWKRHREIPFESATRSMSVICEEDEQMQVVCEDGTRLKKCTVFSKGAVESILEKCTHYQQDGKILPLSDNVKEAIRSENLRLAEKALRVLAFAYKDLSNDEDPRKVKDADLVYVGLMGMIDPPKEGVAESVQEAQALGIRSVMITGDHPVTARAIGIQLGIYQLGDRILTGAELDKLPDEQLDPLICNTSIFARVSPEHKLRIVSAYQRIGETVAMTGDGVNDAPAIRKADVGIAMGRSGTDITKGTAGVVLLEDHFQAILDGVKGGRSIIANIRRAMGCLLSGNLAEVLVTAVSIIVGLPIPLIPLQILLMNVLTDAVPAMVLSTGSNDEVPNKPYRDVIDRSLYKSVVTRGCVLGLGAVAVFAIALGAGVPLQLAQTMTFASLVVGQLLQTIAWRKYGSNQKIAWKKDRVLLAATVGSWLALAATIYVPALSTLFSTVPLGLQHWITIFGVTSALTWISQRWIESSKERIRIPKLRLLAPSYA